MNLSGTVNALRLLYNPSAFIPQIAVSNFSHLPVPIPSAVASDPIKVVVLDKDNCFAEPHTNHVWHEYQPTWKKLKEHYGVGNLLIVSNTAGSKDDLGNEARLVEHNTGVKVFMHSQKKPGCHDELTNYLRSRNLIQHPHQVAVVGDRLMTDVVMANQMGAQSVWIQNGVVPSTSIFSKFEHALYKYYKR